MCIVDGIKPITKEESERIRQELIRDEEEKLKNGFYTGKEVMSLEEINAEIDAYRKGL